MGPDALQRYTFKIFAEPATAVSTARDHFRCFHRWIQEKAVDGLLIDVADYTHLPDGPQRALGRPTKANYAIDGGRGRPGLSYSRKRQADGTLAERLAGGGRTLLTAARLLEADASAMPDGRFTFRGDEIAFLANDRLVAPNTSGDGIGATGCASTVRFHASSVARQSSSWPATTETALASPSGRRDAAPLDRLLDNLR